MKKVGMFAVLVGALFVASAAATDRVRITLKDGTVLNGKVEGGLVVDVETKFGVLKLPINDVWRIDVGYHLNDEETKAVHAALKSLASENFKERASAQDTLTKIGERAHLIVHKHIAKGDAELKKRIEKFIEDTKPDANKLGDLVIAENIKIKGNITNTKFLMKHEALGDLTIQIGHIREILLLGGDTSMTLTTDTDWFEVPNFLVNHHERLLFTATGNVDLWPQAPGQHGCTAKGLVNTSAKGGNYWAGELVGKVGTGQPFRIGDSSAHVADSSGKLYLKIMESPWNNKSTGEYQISIKR